MTKFSDYMVPFIHRCIPFDEWNKIYEYVRTSKDYPAFGYGIKVFVKDFPQLETLANDLPLKDHFFFLISNRKKREFPIHVDGVPGKNNAASLNWPIRNCDNRSPTTWYSCDDIQFKDIDNSFFIKNPDSCIEIHSEAMQTSLEKPYLFRSDLLHRGLSGINEGLRIIVKWELEYDSWSNACADLHNRNYI